MAADLHQKLLVLLDAAWDIHAAIGGRQAHARRVENAAARAHRQALDVIPRKLLPPLAASRQSDTALGERNQAAAQPTNISAHALPIFHRPLSASQRQRRADHECVRVESHSQTRQAM